MLQKPIRSCLIVFASFTLMFLVGIALAFLIFFISLIPSDDEVSCPDKDFDHLLNADVVVLEPINVEAQYFQAFQAEIRDPERVRELANFAIQNETGWYAITMLGTQMPEGWINLNFYGDGVNIGNFGIVQSWGEPLQDMRTLVINEGCRNTPYQYLYLPKKEGRHFVDLIRKE